MALFMEQEAAYDPCRASPAPDKNRLFPRSRNQKWLQSSGGGTKKREIYEPSKSYSEL